MFLNFLLAATLPDWITSSFPVIRTILVALLALLAVIMIVLVLVQESNSGGTNVLSGVRESFYAQNKGASKEGRLKRLMTIAGVAFVVITILYFISLKIYNG